MYKKILSSLLFLVVGTSVYASTQYNGTFKGLPKYWEIYGNNTNKQITSHSR